MAVDEVTGEVTSDHPPSEVRIVDVQIPFFSLVTLLIKITLAAIPAAIVLVILAAITAAIFGRGIGF